MASCFLPEAYRTGVCGFDSFIFACLNGPDGIVGLSGSVSGIILHQEIFLVFGFIHNVDNEAACESLTRSDGSSFSFANKKTDKVSICDTDKIYLLCVVINESVTIKKTRGKAWQAKPRCVAVWCA